MLHRAVISLSAALTVAYHVKITCACYGAFSALAYHVRQFGFASDHFLWQCPSEINSNLKYQLPCGFLLKVYLVLSWNILAKGDKRKANVLNTVKCMIHKNALSQLQESCCYWGKVFLSHKSPDLWESSREVEVNFGAILRCLSYSERIRSPWTAMDKSYNGTSLTSVWAMAVFVRELWLAQCSCSGRVVLFSSLVLNLRAAYDYSKQILLL